ncbi:MAG: helix-hairpin-helix domain-containing protein [Vicinamibacterales bacterium]
MRRVLYGLALCVLLGGVSVGSAVEASQAKPASAKAAAPSGPLNINTATAAQLETLPGIGARTAQAIVDQRQKSGGFKKIEDLMNIKGIGEKSFLKLKPMVTVSADKAEKAGDRQ